MDPNENLAEQRKCIEVMVELDDAASIEDHREWRLYAERLGELSAALDNWLRNGGALPNEWER